MESKNTDDAPEPLALFHLFRSQAFAPPDEAAFQASLDGPRRESARVGAVLAILLFLLFGFLDVLAIPSAVVHVVAIRVGLVVPLLALVLWSTTKPCFPRYYRLIMASMYLGMGLAIQVMILLAQPTDLAFLSYYAGLILVVSALYSWTYLPARQAALIGFGLVAVYAELEMLSRFPGARRLGDGYHHSTVLLSNVFFFASANVIGLVSVLLRERHLREAFLLRQQAEMLSKVKSTFLANMSHEIRTPLNGVLGLAQLGYRESMGHEHLQARFAHILDSGRVLLVVLNDILDFSKIEAGKLELELIPVKPARLLAEVVESVRSQAEAKGLTLTLRCAGLPEGCLGDPVRIAQILINLAANAIKFTEQGAVSVIGRRDGDSLVVEVHDTGIGIAQHALARLFQPFEQADSSTTRRFGGSGLGLAICQRLAELMGGQLEVKSAVGIGSVFTVRLPLHETTAPVPSVLPAGFSHAQRLKHLHILVAEDHEVNQLVLQDMLKQEGAEVTLAANGRLALEAIAQASTPFSLVLMDVQMPELDGIEATRRLRQSHPTLPIIGQTAHALKEEHDKCIAAGMLATVTKPIDAERLVSTLLAFCPPPQVVEPAPDSRSSPVREEAADDADSQQARELEPPAPAARAAESPEALATAAESSNSGPALAPEVPVDTRLAAQALPVREAVPADAPSLSDAIDWAALDVRYAGRPEFVDKLVGLALSSYGGSLEQVQQCLERSDLVRLTQLAHSLKGVAGNLCAPKLEASARGVLEKARASDGSGLEAGTDLAVALERFLQALKQRRVGGS